MNREMWYLLFALCLMALGIDYAKSDEIHCKTRSGRTIELITKGEKTYKLVSINEGIKRTVFIKDTDNFSEVDDYMLESNDKHSIMYYLNCKKVR